jgi:hypothetical protein
MYVPLLLDVRCAIFFSFLIIFYFYSDLNSSFQLSMMMAAWWCHAVLLVLVLCLAQVSEVVSTSRRSFLSSALKHSSPLVTPKQSLRSITPSLVLRGGKTTGAGGVSGGDQDTGISWDSHLNVNEIPTTLLSKLDGSETMRAKFEKLCRESQVSF